MNKLRETVLMRKHGVSINESTAETLFRLLDNDDAQSCVCCTGSYDEAKELVRVRLKRKKKGETPVADDKASRNEDHENHVKDIVHALAIGNGEFLIDVAWIDDLAKHCHRQCPEILGFDLKFRTNAEKRGLHRGCSKTIDLRNLPNFTSFMPCEQAQVQ